MPAAVTAPRNPAPAPRPPARLTPARQPACSPEPHEPLLDALRTAVIGLVRHPDLPDLSLRQMGVLIHLVTEPLERRNRRAIAANLGVSRQAVSRAMERLHACMLAVPLPGCDSHLARFYAITPQGDAWLRAFAASPTIAWRAAA